MKFTVSDYRAPRDKHRWGGSPERIYGLTLCTQHFSFCPRAPISAICFPNFCFPSNRFPNFSFSARPPLRSQMSLHARGQQNSFAGFCGAPPTETRQHRTGGGNRSTRVATKVPEVRAAAELKKPRSNPGLSKPILSGLNTPKPPPLNTIDPCAQRI